MCVCERKCKHCRLEGVVHVFTAIELGVELKFKGELWKYFCYSTSICGFYGEHRKKNMRAFTRQTSQIKSEEALL